MASDDYGFFRRRTDRRQQRSSAPIGDARAGYNEGIISHLNKTALAMGGGVGQPLKAFVDHILELARSGNLPHRP